MGSKHKINVSLSVALALFYAFPWLALSEQFRLAGYTLQKIPVGPRVSFLFCTVLATALLFFQYNLFWKHRWWVMRALHRRLLNGLVNVFLIVFVSALQLWVADSIFSLDAPRAYFTFYLFRNASVALVVVLVAHVVELVERLRQEKIEVLMLQHQGAETELAALRSQIDPHFLFNSLTTLSSLVRTNSPQTVSFIDHLSDTFRYMLERREDKVVTVKDELHFLQSYLFMMQQRFHDGIQVDIRIHAEHMERSIPQFALQIAVENAIKHNIVSAKHALRIEMFSMGHAITVRNNVQQKRSPAGYGIGLANLSQRYRLIGRKDIAVRKDEHFFELELPVL